MEIICSRCGASLTCNPGAECWCMKPPYLPMPAADEGCLCPACLQRATKAAESDRRRPES